MLILVCAVLGVLSPVLFGGSLRRLAGLRLRMAWLPLVALLAQVLIIEVFPRANPTLLSVVHLLTYVAAGAFLWVNRAVPGLLVVAAGAISNGVTIALNGGTLPARAGALEAAGVVHDAGEFTNSGVMTDPVLPWLGDVFAWPAPLPLANVFSVGDLLVVGGLAWGAHRICRSRVTRAGRRPALRQAEPVDA